MLLKKQLLPIFCLLSLSVFSLAGVHLDSDISSEKDSFRISLKNYVPTHISLNDSIVNYGKIFLKTPYHFGSPGVSSFDCSGFTSYVYRNFGYNLGHSSNDQANQFDTVDRSQLKVGDLVYFSGRHRSKRIGHVGIVTSAKENGDFEFIHAAVHSGVTISNSTEEYYSKRYLKANRVINSTQMLAISKFIGKSEKPANETVAFTPVSSPARTLKKVIPAEYHHVKSGETLSSISKEYGITVAELKRKNHIKGNKLNPRQDLKIKDEETDLVVQTIPSNDVSSPAITGNSETNISGMSKGDQQLEKIYASKLHSVKKGETLFSISKLYNISVDELKNLNKLIKGKIHPGQKLKLTRPQIPDKNETLAKVEDSPRSSTHKVLTGETLFGISKSHNMPVEELKKLNNITDGKIHPGMELKLSETKELASEKTEMKLEAKNNEKIISLKIKQGETLGSIAKANNTSVEDLKKLNNLKDSKIHLGQELRVNQNEETKNQNLAVEKIENKREQKNQEKTFTHKIRQGETLGGIAKANDLTVEELKKLNNLKDSKIHLGQELRVNKNEETKALVLAEEKVENKKERKNPEKSLTHKIKQGETLGGIAEANNTTVEELKKLNNLKDSKIHLGQELKLNQNEETKTQILAAEKLENKKGPKTTEGSLTHKIKQGETLGGIAQANNTTVEELKRLNNLKDSKIHLGQELKLNQNEETKGHNTIVENSDKKKEENKENTITHKVKKGESLISIAKENNLTVEELKRINHLSKSEIRFGQELKLTESTEKTNRQSTKLKANRKA